MEVLVQLIKFLIIDLQDFLYLIEFMLYLDQMRNLYAFWMSLKQQLYSIQQIE